jgi:hypothetical protein
MREIRKRPEAQPYILCLVCFLCRAYGKGDGYSTASCASTADGREGSGSGDPWWRRSQQTRPPVWRTTGPRQGRLEVEDEGASVNLNWTAGIKPDIYPFSTLNLGRKSSIRGLGRDRSILNHNRRSEIQRPRLNNGSVKGCSNLSHSFMI